MEVTPIDNAQDPVPKPTMEDGEGDWVRTLALASVQLIPWIGGFVGEIGASVWSSRFEKKIREVVSFYALEIERLGVEVGAINARIQQNEEAEVLVIEVVREATRTVSSAERAQLGRLLARGLSDDERRSADVRFALQRWAELDAVERAIFLELGNAFRDQREKLSAALLFGEIYFASARHADRMTKDDFHRRRLDHLIASGIIKPRDVNLWREGKLGYDLDSFWLTSIGDLLYALIAGELGDPR